MFAHDIGAEERLLYLVPRGSQPEGNQTEPIQVQPAPKLISWGAALARALKAKALAILMAALMAALLFMPQLVSRASTAITIDTDVLFGSVNDWIATFLPIFAIGLGIAIALAIIAIVGDSILMGLRRGVH